MSKRIAIDVLQGATTVILEILSIVFSSFFLIYHIAMDNHTPKGQYFVYRPMYMSLGKSLKPQWIFRKYVRRDLHEFGSTSETYTSWYTYHSLNEDLNHEDGV